MRSRKSLWLVAVLLLAGAAAAWWAYRWSHCVGCAVLHGGDGGGWPRATPEAEKFAPEVARQAAEYAAKRGALLLVARHGHLVLAGDRKTDDELFGSRGLAGPLPLLIEPGGDGMQKLSRELWQPLNAADGRMRCASMQPALRDCRLWARAGDWLRVGQLLLDRGRFEGEQLIDASRLEKLAASVPPPPGWLLAGRAARGAEPLVDANASFLRGEGRTRLWLAPSVGLVVLLLDDDNAGNDYDETELPNMLVRGLLDRPQGRAADARDGDQQPASQLAPGH